MEKVIRKIHKKFDTAGEKLLAEAKALVAAAPVNEAERIARFQKIGFTSGKPIRDAEQMFAKQQRAQETIEAIEYFQTYYPSYKFIAEEQIQKICKKYGLLYGDADKYIGDIPEKNLAEIEAFKLREEDYSDDSMFLGEYMRRLTERYSSPDIFFPWVTGIDPIRLPEPTPAPSVTVTLKAENKEEVKKAKPQFKICAPKKDFSIRADDRVKDGWKLLDDPIVIQPVKYKEIVGGLIISKWGLEANDESLVNEINN